MSQNLLKELTDLLAADDRLVSEGKLMRNKVVELALNFDAGFLSLLLKNESIKHHFFTQCGEAWVFDKVKFHKFVNNKSFLKDSFTSFKNSIGLTSEGEFIADGKDVVLAWPYKDCVLEGGQTKEDVKRNEVFWNETLAPDEIDKLLTPKALAGFKKYNKDSVTAADSVAQSDNLIIKGNNLLTLHTLAAVYEGRVKLIYIDPPYNTENDSFTYNDTFSHSTWLSFMRNRLEIAQKLLASDGVLVMSIDQNEAFYLKVLSDEIFGRENFIAAVTVQNNPKGRVLGKKAFATSHEYLLFYSTRKLDGGLSVKKSEAQIEKEYSLKDEEGFRYRELELRNTHREFGRNEPAPYNRENLFFPLYVAPSDGSVSLEKDDEHTEKVEPIWDDNFEGCWTWSTNKCEIESDLLVGHLVKEKWKIYRKSYADNGGQTVSRKLKTIWFHKDFHTEKGQKVVDELVGKNKFRSPKPVGLIRTIVDLVTSSDSNDLVLDFFAGSGTTAQAVLELNQSDGGQRQFILCEQLEYVESVTTPRVAKVAETSQTSFVYCELALANEAFVQMITGAKDSTELWGIWTKMQERAFLSYRTDTKAFNTQEGEFKSLAIDDQREILLDVLDKNMLYVPLSELDDANFGLSESDKKLNRQFFGLVTA